VLLATVVLVGSTISMRGQGQRQSNQNRSNKAQQKADFEDHSPIADYGGPEPTDPQERSKRKSKDNRFAKGVLDELADVTETEIVDGSGLERRPVLPVTLSDTIIVGNVLNGRAYLSNNKTGIFSEFVINIEEVLKTTGNDSVVPGANILTEREGGRIRYPSGRIRWIRFAHEGMPLVGSRYVLFLRRTIQGEALSILTAYEFRAGKVFPLDGVAAFEEHKLSKFAAYEGVPESTFLGTVRELLK
jgi:hypothetical protein